MNRSPKPRMDGKQPDSPPAGAETARRRRWERPRLTAYGDLRELTMGGTPGSGESGGGGTMFFPPP